MRVFLFVLALGSLAMPAAAQCPVQLREATIDVTANKIVIRYYNSGVRPVRDVHFILTRESASDGQSIISRLTARGVVLPSQERTSVFPKATAFPSNFSFAVEVLGASFDDDETWISTKQRQCTILFSRQ